MRSVEQALDLVRKAAGAPRRLTETVMLGASLGRVLAEDVAMDHDVPPFRRATMDGFALRAADLAEGARLPVVGRSTAGDAEPPDLAAGQAVRIMTGAPLPPTADHSLSAAALPSGSERRVACCRSCSGTKLGWMLRRMAAMRRPLEAKARPAHWWPATP